jgi:hypothetical protein
MQLLNSCYTLQQEGLGKSAKIFKQFARVKKELVNQIKNQLGKIKNCKLQC